MIVNARARRIAYPRELQDILNIARAREDRAWLVGWSELSPLATPLYALPDLAAELGLAAVSIKDESRRSPLGSFKALGAPIALLRLILRLHPTAPFDPSGLLAGRHAEQLRNFTVVSATDGNHGRGLAAASRSIGCRCVIVLHAQVSPERERAIAECGAQIVRVAGNYDASVEEARRLAVAKGWQVVSDTSYEGYEAVPRDVMQGYAVIAAEVIEATASIRGEPGPFTHVFVQGGVGGLAAGVGSYFWEHHQENRPRFMLVEPQQADCLYQSARAGHVTGASGSVDSVMAGLACGIPSPLAWRFLQPLIDCFLTVSDQEAIHAMRRLAGGSVQDVPVVSGESGAAGLAGLLALSRDSAARRAAGLNHGSRVLLINTEGATAPGLYADLVGESAQSVCSRQAAWLLQRSTPCGLG